MIKTALSASLIALAVLAPAASAAPELKPNPDKEPKAPVLDAKAAKICADLAAIKPDKHGVITLTAKQLAFQAKLQCPAEEPSVKVKPPRQTEPAAPTCRTLPAEVDPKAPPAPKLTKLELEALKKLPLCSADEPVERCVMVDPIEYAKAHAHRRTSGAAPPAWVQNYDECMLPQLGKRSGLGPTDGTKDKPQA